jgi:TadE-like protein
MSRTSAIRPAAHARAGLLADRRGTTTVEFALSATVFFVFLFGIIDFGRLFWEWNSAAKATHWGARLATVNAPVATGLATFNGLAAAGGNGLPVPLNAVPVVTCSLADTVACSAMGPANAAKFNAIVARMQSIYGRIRPENVVVEYRHVGLGFAGNPFGPGITPLITVRLRGLQFNFITPGLLGVATITLPGFATSMVAEDLEDPPS